MCINYALLGFYLCRFGRYYCAKETYLRVTLDYYKRKIYFLSYRIIMLNLSVTELRSIENNRGIKRYNSLDKDELLKTILLLSLSLGELKSISKFRKIRNYENCLKMNC